MFEKFPRFQRRRQDFSSGEHFMGRLRGGSRGGAPTRMPENFRKFTKNS